MVCILNVSCLWSGYKPENHKQKLALQEKKESSEIEESDRLLVFHLKVKCYTTTSNTDSDECERLIQFWSKYLDEKSPD